MNEGENRSVQARSESEMRGLDEEMDDDSFDLYNGDCYESPDVSYCVDLRHSLPVCNHVIHPHVVNEASREKGSDTRHHPEYLPKRAQKSVSNGGA